MVKMNKIGIYYAYWTHEWDADFHPFVDKVAALGFDLLEVNGGTTRVERGALELSGALRRVASRLGESSRTCHLIDAPVARSSARPPATR